MSSFKKNDEVVVLDYPFGKPINVTGRIVGLLAEDKYNVMIKSGLHAGQIRSYKYWKLKLLRESVESKN